MATNVSWKWIWIGVWSFLVIAVQISSQRSSQESDSYVAAVVEYPSSYKPGDGPSTLRENLESYLKHIKQASEKDADIIVFPEDGLTSIRLPPRAEMDSWTTVIPAASDRYVPCTGSASGVSDTLKRLSCAAKEHAIYVVVNIAEKYCEKKCSANETIYYNTNVVFDRAGQIIARYRKVNLFEEPQFSVTEIPEVVTFETDFGVKFGTFICFDILFYKPALSLTRDQGITDIVFSTAWFSERPFLTAVQTQFGWSFVEDVNLLASGYNRPGLGSTGSGIYLGRKGIGKAVFARNVLDELLIYRVPKIKRGDASHKPSSLNETKENQWRMQYDTSGRTVEVTENNDIMLLVDNLKDYETASFTDFISQQLCHGSFCCDFKVTAKNIDPTTKYRIAVYDGVRLYGTRFTGGIRVCGVIQCLNDSLSSCGSVHNSETTFTSMEITGTYEDYKKLLTIPTTLISSSLLPLENFEYDEHSHDNHVHVTMSLRNETKNIATFGIYSRDFTRDLRNGVNTVNLSLGILTLPLFISLLCIHK